MKAEQKLYETDPEFMERFEHFAYEEVVKEEGQTLDEKTRYRAILARFLDVRAWMYLRLHCRRRWMQVFLR